MWLTIWEASFNRNVNQQMGKSRRYANLISKTVNRLNGGYYDSHYLASLFLKSKDACTLYDAAAFIDLHTAICTGGILTATIEFGEYPSADALGDENNEKLSTLSSRTYYSVDKAGVARDEQLTVQASFNGKSIGFDGFFEWQGPLVFSCANGKKPIEQVHLSGVLPLEVGTTSSQRTIGHLSMDRGLARWPYGSSKIWLFKVVDNGLWTSGVPRAPKGETPVHSAMSSNAYQQLSLF